MSSLMDNRYLQDIERLKKLEPIMQELGVKAERMPLGEFFTIGHHQYQLTYLTLRVIYIIDIH